MRSFYVVRAMPATFFDIPLLVRRCAGIRTSSGLLRGAVLLALCLSLSAGTAQAALCTAVPGGRVVLESDAVDPDVFLWDSRTRLVDYAAGQWGNTRAIFAHTVLAQPGTQATVVSCIPAVARPKFSSGDADAIGVKIINGPYRGRYGWVLSSDVRNSRAAGGPAQNAIVKTTKN